jgi:hypothetical protein
VSFSVCGGTGGLDAVLHERRIFRRQTRAERFRSRDLAPTGGGCRQYTLAWSVRPRFFGRGRHTVELHVRDALGRISNGAERAYGPR